MTLDLSTSSSSSSDEEGGGGSTNYAAVRHQKALNLKSRKGGLASQKNPNHKIVTSDSPRASMKSRPSVQRQSEGFFQPTPAGSYVEDDKNIK